MNVSSLLHFQLKEDDSLPKNVCQKCLSDLSFVSEFIDKCQKSEEILQRSLQYNENAIICNDIVTEIKIEEHDLPPEPAIKMESLTIKEEPNLEEFDIMEEESISDDCSNSKYYLYYIIYLTLKQAYKCFLFTFTDKM